MSVTIKRAYDKPGGEDGTRILVDRLWPRGISKADLKIVKWEKAIAPSQALRKWYAHDPEKWPEFHRRYRQELKESSRKEVLDQLIGLAEKGNLTLIFGTRDAERSNAAVVAEVIHEKLQGDRTSTKNAGRKKRKPGTQ